MRTTGYWLALLLPFILLIAMLALRSVDPGPVQAVRHAAFDSYQVLRPRRLPKSGPAVLVVEIDGESRQRVGPWPWPRTKLAELINKLAAAKVRAVAVLLDLSQPDPNSPQRLLQRLPQTDALKNLAATLPKTSDPDKELARALALRPAVIGLTVTGAATNRLPARKSSLTALAGIGNTVPRLAGARAAIQLLEAAAAGNGLRQPPLAPGDATRQLPLAFRIGNDIYPTVEAELARLTQKAKRVLMQPSESPGFIGGGMALGQFRIGSRVVPVDAQARMWLHAAPQSSARRFAAWRILDGTVPAEQLANRVVLITLRSPSTPLWRTPLGDLLTLPLISAQALEQILQKRYLSRPGFAIELEIGYALIVSLLLILLLGRVRGYVALLLSVGAILLPMAVGWAAFVRYGWLIDGFMPALTVLVVAISAALAAEVRQRTRREQLTLRLQRNLPPRLLRRYIREERVSPADRSAHPITALHLNVRDFDRAVRQLGPQDATALLRRLWSPATGVVFANGGTLDKYVGDRLMAFWNAPVEQDDHVELACRAALELMSTANKLNERLASESPEAARRSELEVAIALEAGDAFVGDAGAAQRFEFSAVGLPVATAWRLSSQSRYYGVSIIAGPGVREATDRFAFLELDMLRLNAGAPIRIYTLLGDEGLAADPAFQALSARNDTMLTHYRARRWAEAQAALAEAREIADGRLDALYDMYSTRLRAFRATPPPDDWDGASEADQSVGW